MAQPPFTPDDIVRRVPDSGSRWVVDRCEMIEQGWQVQAHRQDDPSFTIWKPARMLATLD